MNYLCWCGIHFAFFSTESNDDHAFLHNRYLFMITMSNVDLAIAPSQLFELDASNQKLFKKRERGLLTVPFDFISHFDSRIKNIPEYRNALNISIMQAFFSQINKPAYIHHCCFNTKTPSFQKMNSNCKIMQCWDCHIFVIAKPIPRMMVCMKKWASIRKWNFL